MSEIRFDKLSKYDRQGEPITVAVPFSKGQLRGPEGFGIQDGEVSVFSQTEVTGQWDDGSVKWLLAHFLSDLPGNESHRMSFVCDGSVEASEPDPGVRVVEGSDGIEIDTGPLQVLCAREGFDLFREVKLNGEEIFRSGGFSGFYIVDEGGRRYETGKARVESIEVLDGGPVRAVVEFSGVHQGEEGVLFDFRVLVYAWSGKPWLDVEYQFINRERSGDVMLSEVGLVIRPEQSGEVKCAIGEGNVIGTHIQEGTGELVLDKETIIYQEVEHVLETFYGVYWADWCDGEKGVTVSPFQAHQNFPKGLKVTEEGIDVGIFPAGQPSVKILQGVAKTHRFRFYFHGPEMSFDDVNVQSLQFQYADVGILPESWYRASGVWEDLFPEKRCLKLDTRIIDMADNRCRGLGMLHWGDGPDEGYTEQGRGKGDLVWTNNEYDFPHAMFLLFARTGERRFLDAGLVSSQHWIDVDFCHFSEDPLKMGGQPIHTAGHVTGGVTPSHEWTEGLFDLYHLTGKREAREKAVSIADNMLRHLESSKFSEGGGGFQARETGWALRGLIAAHVETGESRYLDACRGIGDQFVQWKEEWGAFLGPYTSHTQVRVPFMISIAVNALMRYYRATGDERAGALIVSEMQDMVDNCVMPDGRFYYKELPSLNRRLSEPLMMEALCHAYSLSGEERFLKHAYRELEMMLERGGGGRGGGKSIVGDAVIFGGPGPKGIASTYIPLMVAYKTLSDSGMLDDIDYRPI